MFILGDIFFKVELPFKRNAVMGLCLQIAEEVQYSD